MKNVLEKHTKIALQVSGGRDSMACLYRLHEEGLLHLVTVYWLNTGAAFPETKAIMDHVRELAPNFVEIAGNQPEVIARFGMPTDILPRTSTPIGVVTGQSPVLMQDTYSCCARVVMEPMHRRMLQDEVTLIIRGQRANDGHRSPLSSGDTELGIEYLFPIEDWTAEQVDSYLREQGGPIHPAYEFMTQTPDCMTCSGWWEDNRAAFLKARHPEAYAEYQRRLDIIRENVEPHIFRFNKETGGQNG